ncbi:MAG: DUF2281 domain-containing protein [Candidatus Brocadia sp.]|nr:DUF2281 domain-containing protein [Candidatus Brocadia sp.]NUO09651.1 DUF2281 domain-containing protein [Candidatus Brocadia sp.]
MKSLEEMIKKLPIEYEQEVQDFIEFILEKRVKKHKGKPKFDWGGALKHLKNYTSVELQHEISKLRTGEK